MKRALLVAAMCSFALSLPAFSADTDWSKVDRVFGKNGSDQPGGVHKFSFPRTDLKVSVDGIELEPAFALGSWVAFVSTPSGAMCMGDLVLLETEISPVMKQLIEGGFDISAIHNHLLRTSQRIVYMHISAHGDTVKLAETIRSSLALSKTPLTQAAASAPRALQIDTSTIDTIVGFKGTRNGGVYQLSIPRTETITDNGMNLPPSMGTAIAINFQPTADGKVITTGDFVLLGKEVNPVLKTLRRNGIEVTALHSHMIEDSPHLYFMHFWAHDEVKKLAQGLRQALDNTNVKRSS